MKRERGRERMEESGRVKPQKRRDTYGTNFGDSFKIAVTSPFMDIK